MILASGFAVDRSSGGAAAFEIRMLAGTDLPAVTELQSQLARELGDDYIPSRPDAVIAMLDQGVSPGLFIQGRLEGIRLVYDRRPISALFRSALPPHANDFTDFAQFTGVIVAKRYAGNGLGLRMTQMAVDALRLAGRKHIGATVAPSRFASLRNLFQCGFVVRAGARLPGGSPRLVLHRELVAESLGHCVGFTAVGFTAVDFTDETLTLVDSNDWDAQLALMKSGFVGSTVLPIEAGHRIGYRRSSSSAAV